MSGDPTSQMITNDQCRAARGLINWSQSQLAQNSKTGLSTVRNFEAGRSVPRPLYMDAIEVALTKAGVEFIAGGVRLKKP